MKYKKTIISVITLMSLSLAVYVGISVYFKNLAKDSIDEEIENISSFADIKYEDVRIDVIRQHIYITGVTLKTKFLDEHIKIEQLMFYENKHKNKDATEAHFRLQGIQLIPSGRLRPYLVQMGYQDITAEVEGGFSHDTDKQTLKLLRLRMAADNVGSAELSLHLENIDPRNLGRIPKNVVILLAMISGVKIAGAEFMYKDDSLIRNLYNIGASRSNLPIESFVKDMTDQVDGLLLDYKNPKAQMLLKRVRKFIVSPEKLHILIEPPKPIPVARFFFLDNPAQAIDMLGLRVDT